MDDPRTIVTNVRPIFSLPDVVVRVNDLIDSGEATNTELERVIASDPALTAKILKFANSSYFGFSGKVETVLKAIAIIGHKELRNLVLATSVTSTFKDIPPIWWTWIPSGITVSLAELLRAYWLPVSTAGSVFLSPDCCMAWSD
jgi:c-di-GMP-related signal transduction protein